jgi:serine/threonine-protein phosphatase 2A regulatory subunit B
VPSCVSTDVVFSARCRRQFGAAHAYHINSLSVNSDCETYISADDLRVNLWHLERGAAEDAFTVVDIKPENMEDLTEVITSAEFHPSRCDLFAYSSSKGSIRLADMRQNALCANHAKMFDAPEAPGSRSFFSEIIASVSDVKFSRDGRFILSRDYLNLRLWDVRNENAPGRDVQSARALTGEAVRSLRERRDFRQVPVLPQRRRRARRDWIVREPVQELRRRHRRERRV